MQKEQYRKLIIELANEIEDEHCLRWVLTYMAACQNKELKEVDGTYTLVDIDKRGVSR